MYTLTVTVADNIVRGRAAVRARVSYDPALLPLTATQLSRLAAVIGTLTASVQQVAGASSVNVQTI